MRRNDEQILAFWLRQLCRWHYYFEKGRPTYKNLLSLWAQWDIELETCAHGTFKKIYFKVKELTIDTIAHDRYIKKH